MLRRLFDHSAIVARRVSDRGRDGFTGVIITAVGWAVIVRPFLEAFDVLFAKEIYISAILRLSSGQKRWAK